MWGDVGRCREMWGDVGRYTACSSAARRPSCSPCSSPRSPCSARRPPPNPNPNPNPDLTLNPDPTPKPTASRLSPLWAARRGGHADVEAMLVAAGATELAEAVPANEPRD